MPCIDSTSTCSPMMTTTSLDDRASTIAPLSPTSDGQLVEDQLLMLLVTEDSYQVPHVPCTAVSSSTDSDDRVPYPEWRRKICQWSFKVIDHFRLDREAVSCAMNIFDRYLACMPATSGGACSCPSCQRSVDSRTFQLTAMTSLYIAMKMNSESSGTQDMQSGPRKLRLVSFVELSRGQFTADDLKQMERQVLQTLKWKVHPPTPMTMVSYLLRLMPSHSSPSYNLVLHVLHELSRYLTELSVCLGSECSIHTSSQIAYSAILVSMDLLTNAALPYSVRGLFNEAVVGLSAASGGTILTPHDEPIQYLQERLRQAFWPEMLMDDCHAQSGHPISMARDYGLLDIASITTGQYGHHSPPSTPSPYGYAPNTTSKWGQDDQASPVSVTRTAI